MRYMAVINYGENEMAIGLGDTEEVAASNAVEAYGGPEHLRHGIFIHDLVDGVRLLFNEYSPSRLYRGPITAEKAPSLR